MVIEDIDDTEGFLISLFPPGVEPRLKEDVLQEGYVILLGLLAKYEPGKGGRDAKGSRFSGYAARYLPAKLREVYLYMTGHTKGQARGKRHWTKPPQVVSFEQLPPFRRYEALEVLDPEEDDWDARLLAAVLRFHGLDLGETWGEMLAGIEGLSPDQGARVYVATGDWDLLRRRAEGCGPRGPVPLHLKAIAEDPDLQPPPARLYGAGGGRTKNGPGLDELDRLAGMRRLPWGEAERPVDEFADRRPVRSVRASH